MSDYYFPAEEIFKWLPVKTLLRFRSLSKSLKALIDSPFFIEQHLAVQSRRLLIKFEHETELLVLDPCNRTSVETLSIPLAFAETLYDPEEDLVLETFRLVGTLHGVVCLYDHSNSSFLIWNPSLRKSMSINFPFDSLHFDWRCDYVDNLPYFGFWIDLSGQHFKILVLKLAASSSLDDGNKSMGGVLYSSIRKKWEPVPLDGLKDLRGYPENPPVMIDGVAYWIAERDQYTDSEGSFLSIGILSFDFARQCANTIEVPGYKNYNITRYPVLCILQDALGLAYWQQDSDRCDVLIRNEVEGIWVKLYAFELPLDRSFRVRCVMGETEDACRVIVETVNHLLLLDAKGKEDGTVLRTREWEYCTIHAAYGFKESLLC